MNDDAPKKRSWFQVHLSTAVVLMITAGVLMLANLRPPKIVDYDQFLTLSFYSSGWPFRELNTFEQKGSPNLRELLEIEDLRQELLSLRNTSRFSSLPTMLANVAVALAILTAVAMGCEWWVRRRERKLIA